MEQTRPPDSAGNKSKDQPSKHAHREVPGPAPGHYLQQNGLLTRFYREFKDNQPADPSGYKTLQKMLRENDMAAFQQKWEKFVLELRFGNP